MKKTYLLLITLLIPAFSFSQIVWQSSINDAIPYAKANNKLILVDFWASWCGPCLKMDGDVWNTAEIASYKDNFVFTKVNADQNRADMNAFGVKVLPTILVIDISKNKLIELQGYQHLSYMQSLLKQFPDDIEAVYAHLATLEDDNKDWQAHLDAAVAYTDYVKDIESSKVSNAFMSAAGLHFRKAKKLVKGDAQKYEAVEIFEAMSRMYTRPDKMLKSLDKLHEESTGENEALFDFAYCSGCIENGNMAEAKAYYEKVASANREDLVNKLDTHFASKD